MGDFVSFPTRDVCNKKSSWMGFWISHFYWKFPT